MKEDIMIIDGNYYPLPIFVSDWIFDDEEDGEQPVPDNILKHYNVTDNDLKTVYLSCSASNDKGLYITNLATSFNSLNKLVQYFSTNNIEIGEDYHFLEY